MGIKIPKKLSGVPKRAGFFSLAMVVAASGLIWWRPGRAHAQTDTFTTSGTWNVPSGVSSADFEAWGGGGAGGGTSSNNSGGAGGAGGQYAIKNLTGLITGNTYTVTVAGTTAGTTGAGSAGGDSGVVSPAPAQVVLAKGGAGGAANSGAPGVGSTSLGLGDTVFAGGTGGNGAAGGSGAGGGGAGSTGNGGNGGGISAGSGTANNGGNGGNGQTSTNVGSPGSNYGGAGGGAFKTSAGAKAGGAGAQGLVTITYTVVNQPPSAPSLLSPGAGQTILPSSTTFIMVATDPDGDTIKYKLFLYDTPANTGGNCTGSLLETGDQTSSGTGWNNGTTAYGSGIPADYVIQTALTPGNGYCWQAQAIDPTGSNTFSSLAAASTFTVNTTPSVPSIIAPTPGATGVSTLPAFQLRSRDTNSDVLRYQVVLYDSDCASPPPPYVAVQTFDENSDVFLQTGWSGQDASALDTDAAYVGSNVLSSSTIATYTNYLLTLNTNHTYCWKGAAIDPDGSNTYSSYSSTQTFTTIGPASAVNIGGGVKINGGSLIQ